MSDRLWIAYGVFENMCELATRLFPLETGGMLLGYRADNNEAVVTEIVGPGPKARHSRYRFKPDPDYQQQELESHFHRTEGKETYLGDWHTHPYGTSMLSLIDRRTLRRIALTPSSGTPHPIMVIMAGEVTDWRLGAVRFISSKREILFHTYQVQELTPYFYYGN